MRYLLIAILLVLTGCSGNISGDASSSTSQSIIDESQKNTTIFDDGYKQVITAKEITKEVYNGMEEDISLRTSDSQTFVKQKLLDGKKELVKKIFLEDVFSYNQIEKKWYQIDYEKIDGQLVGAVSDSESSADVDIDQEDPNVNKNSRVCLTAIDSWGLKRRTVFRITLPSGSDTITSVTMNGTDSGCINTPNISQNIHSMTRTNWTETGATWNKYDGTNSWTAAGGDYSSTVVDSVNSVASGSLQSFVLLGTGATNPMTINWGDTLNLLIKNTTENHQGWQGSGWYNRAAATVSYRPYIEITYTSSAAAPLPTQQMEIFE